VVGSFDKVVIDGPNHSNNVSGGLASLFLIGSFQATDLKPAIGNQLGIRTLKLKIIRSEGMTWNNESGGKKKAQKEKKNNDLRKDERNRFHILP